MRVDIDLVADALSVGWGRRGRASSQVIGRPGRQGARVLYSERGDVVGFEVLGWSTRAQDPTEVAVSVHAASSAEVLSVDDELAKALAAATVETDQEHRPIQNGQPMITLAEAALLIGRERSWLSREMTAGRLLALKIGRTWWTSRSWVDAYLDSRLTRPRARSVAR